MLNLYRRHQAPCRFTTRSNRNRSCTCPIWVQGSLRGESIRRGLNLRSWSAATDLVRDWEAVGEIVVVKPVEAPTITEAVEKFSVDAKAQHLSHETIREYENLLNNRLLPWCAEQGVPVLEAARRGGDARLSRQLERQRELRDQESRAAAVILPLLPAGRVDDEEPGARRECALGQGNADAAVFESGDGADPRGLRSLPRRPGPLARLRAGDVALGHADRRGSWPESFLY